MRLTPHEQDRLLISYAADLARRRRERGLLLNHPEAAERHEDALVTRELALRGEASRVWLIEKPIRPSGKNPFKPWMLAIAGAIAGLALAAGIVIALELIDPTLRSEQILARKTEAPMLIRLPVLGVEKKR